jgi:hypothetical protein
MRGWSVQAYFSRRCNPFVDSRNLEYSGAAAEYGKHHGGGHAGERGLGTEASGAGDGWIEIQFLKKTTLSLVFKKIKNLIIVCNM